MGEVQRPTFSSSSAAVILLPPGAVDSSVAASRDDSAASRPAPPPPSFSSSSRDPPGQHAPPPPRFDSSRMIGIIRRKALIKDLAAVYHAECLAYCPELLELQRKVEELFADVKCQEEVRKELMRPPKRTKKVR